MRRRYSALRTTGVALLAVVPVATSACGLAYTRGPPPEHPQMSHFVCTKGNTLPMLDMAVVGLQISGGLGGNATTRLGSGVLYAISAYMGFNKTKRCRDAKRQLVNRNMRVLESPPIEPGELVLPEQLMRAQVAPGERVRVKQDCAEVSTDSSAIRVRTVCPPHVGTFTMMAADSIVLGTGGSGSRTGVSLASVTSLEVSRGRMSRTGSGALVGFAVGAVYGAMQGGSWAQGCDEPHFWPCSDPAAMAVLGVFFGGIGMGMGAMIGGFIRTDRWEEVPLDRVRVSFAPRRDGFAVGLSVAF